MDASTAHRSRFANVGAFLRSMIEEATPGVPLFWVWNIVFVAFAVLGFAPVALVDILRDLRQASVTPAFVVWGLAFVLIPIVTMVLAYWLLRDRKNTLYALFYGVEAPLLLISAVRLFIIRDMQPLVATLYVFSLIGLTALALEIFIGRREDASRPVLVARFIGLTLLLCTGLYVAVWLAFVVAPVAWIYVEIAVEIIQDLIRDFRRIVTNFSWERLTREGSRDVVFAFLGIPLLFLTAALFIVSPVLVPALYVRRWLHAMRGLAARTGPLVPAGIAASVVAIWIGLYAVTATQPQHAAFAALEAVMEGESGSATASQRVDLAAREDEMRAGLLNAYLARYRYAGVSGVYRQIDEIYMDAFGRSGDYEAALSAYDRVARPFLYEPVNPVTGETRAEEDPARAAQLYAAFYDEPIIEAEHEAVRYAVRSTWRPDQAAAGLSDIEDRDVRLERQTLTVTPLGDIAEIELYEAYRNQTFTQQEVFYYLTLPESAVVTGLWLGVSPDKEQADVFRVATRGAAQEVYLRQRRINRDPALMEQIGPRQYRLRIFPIPARDRRPDETTGAPVPSEGDALHLWLRYRVLAADGAYPTPALAERRNVYWDRDTERVLDGAHADWADDEWLPRSIPATGQSDPIEHRADFEGGVSVVAVPEEGSASGIIGQARIAVVLDRSRSMGDLDHKVSGALSTLEALATATSIVSTVDVFLTASPVRGESPKVVSLFDVSETDLTYFGGMTAAELLEQFDSLRADQNYDAIVLLTDDGGFTPEADIEHIPDLDAPLWFVHVGGSDPSGYPDALLEDMRSSGGGAASSVFEALSRALGSGSEDGGEGGEVVDGYRWRVVDTKDVGLHAPNAVPEPDFEPLAARMLILDAQRKARADLASSDETARLAGLDALHGLAVQHGIVTPYSSMIVLVNAWQHNDLDRLEKQGDRFAREIEDQGPERRDLALAPVTAVPEPGEWLLMLLAAAAVAMMARRQFVNEKAGAGIGL